MSYPIYPDKYRSEPVLSAAEWLAFRRATGSLGGFKPPAGMLLFFQRHPLDYAVRQYDARPVKGFLGDCDLLDRKGKPRRGIRQPSAPFAGVAGGFGIGAPAAVAMLEELAAAGVRKFIAVGLAGSLQASLKASDLVVCDKAIRDEGTSYHYLPAERFALASPEITLRLQEALEAAGQTYLTGPRWTTDAPYRETRGEVEYYSQEGVLAVDMEAAGLFAAGQALGVQVGAAFCIADNLSEGKPKLDLKALLINRSLESLVRAALEAIDEPHHRD